MARWRIYRDRREVGYLDAPGWVLEAGITPLPGFEGNDTGLAFVVALRGRPLAAVIYPWSEDAIEIGHSTRVSFTEAQRTPQTDRAIAAFEATIDLFAPEPPGISADIFWRLRTSQGELRRSTREPWEFSLEVHDDDSLDASVRWVSSGLPGIAEGHFRGSFRSRGGEVRGGGEFSGGFEFDRRGPGEGYIRGRFSGQGAENLRDLYVDLGFDSRLSGRGLAYLRVRGQYHSAEDEQAVFSIPWLFQKVFANLQARERGVPFTLWIGRVSYDSSTSDLYSDAAVRRTLAASLVENRPLSGRELLSVTRWLQFQLSSEDLSSAGTWREGLQLPSMAFRTKAPARTDCDFIFDASIPAEKVLELLAAVAKAVHQRGGRLCFRRDPEE